MKTYQITRKDESTRTIQSNASIQNIWKENPESKYIRQCITDTNSFYEIGKTIVSAIIRNGYKHGNDYMLTLEKMPWNEPDKEDLLQTAVCALIEYQNETPETYYKQAYKAVESVVWKERKRTPKESDAMTIIRNMNNDIAHEVNSGNGYGWTNIQEYLTTLTPKQKKILKLTACGYSVRQVAEKLHIAKSTVSEQLKAIRRKAKPYNPYTK